MSDDDSEERRKEEARMREFLQVAMGADETDEDEKPSKKKKEKKEKKEKKSKRSILHSKLTESISSSRDSRLSEEDASKILGSKRLGSTGVSEGSHTRPDSFNRKARERLDRYDQTTVILVIFSIAGALALTYNLMVPAAPQMGLQLPQKATPFSFGSATPTECDEIITMLDENIFVNSTALNEEGSPQHQAMHWICSHDPAELNVNDPGFLTRYALAVFFYATSGRSPTDTASDKTDWTEHSAWLTEAGYCSWFGITCVDEEGNPQLATNGEILQIDLSQNFLSGSLPPELSALSDALGIHLDSNFLYGTIPTQFGRLSKLEDLWLSDNKLEGMIPKELGNMSELRELTLAANGLTGEIPETLSQATHLHYFAAEDNHLKGTIPAVWFRSMTALETFHVSNNELTGSIPEELYDMASLATLRLSENELSGTISGKLGQLTNLEHLHLTDNHFTGELPGDAFPTMEMLTECKLGQNGFTGGVPASLGENQALASLALEGNPLTGEVPEELCALTQNGSLVSLTADCEAEIEAHKGTLDMSNVEGAEIFDWQPLSGLTEEEDEEVELEGVICDCCTQCF